ncbi:choice-of-anchor L domain-containing protein [Alteromonas stellipolaris]|uniref:choice-of-anchor L domain-containing protein n=1 Tax=Alteromonas stellipolaris TaxID=233316 RepID=UPI002736CA51|nr:choice-of-anchor L domain-containing protein [Alteromonas stellipolaris]MDP2537344.1 choice-of-anchor L domain-containing protein [Alteromonas stellipolaris]
MPFSKKIIKISTFTLSVLFSAQYANAIVIESSDSAEFLTDALFINNSGLTITDQSLSGQFGQAGVYINNSGTYGLPSAGGIVFSTGQVIDYVDGPNEFIENGFGSVESPLPPSDNGNELEAQFSNNSVDYFEQVEANEGGNEQSGPEDGGADEYVPQNPASAAQNTILTPITGQAEHFDAVQLDITFDVSDDVNTVSFIAAFGSEEFPGYVDSDYTDGFALLLNGVNVAFAPVAELAVDGVFAPISIDHPDFEAIEGTELNGLLAPNGIPLLQFDIPVEPGSTGNTFTMLLADASDDALDTTVYLSSFGNFDVENGESEFTPLMPDEDVEVGEESEFVFTLPEVEAGETIWFDPDVSTGYTYTAGNGGQFASVTAPTLLSVNDADGYLITFTDSLGVEETKALMAGQTLDFPFPVTTFTLTGINEDLMLDPTDPTAFVTGVSFEDTGSYTVSQAAIITSTTSVPAPSSIAIFLLSLVGISLTRKHERSQA